jgi:antirestriction protein ArdC
MSDNPKPDRVAETMARTTVALVAAIESGAADPAHWSAPWHNQPAALPVNATTGRAYTGGNALTLWFAVADGASPYWATFNQWRDLSTPDAPISVRKGERGTFILRPRIGKVTDKETGAETSKVFGFSGHAIFHAGQVDGWTPPAPTVHALPGNDSADVDACFRWMATTGARVDEHATRGASYSPTFDVVTMPERSRFTSAHGAWSTGAHELIHWTGHTSRLARDLSGRFGDDAYAAEELVAELGAAFTLAALGRTSEPRPDHARYLASWLRVLRSRPDALWTVAGKATTAATYLVDRAITHEPEPAAELAVA